MQGCSGIGDQNFTETPYNFIDDGLQTVLTSEGFEFLYENRRTILGLLFNVDQNGWVEIPVQDFEQPGDRISLALRDVSLGIEIETAELEIEIRPQPIGIVVSIRNARMRFNQAVASVMGLLNGACRLENGVNRETDSASFALIDTSLVIYPSIERSGALDLRLSLEQLDIRAFNIDFVYDAELVECGNRNCEALCNTGELSSGVTEVLYDAFRERIDTVLTPVLETLVNETLRDLNANPFRIEGQIEADILSMLIPVPRDAYQIKYRTRPNTDEFNYVARPGRPAGIGVKFGVGLDTTTHPCVPALQQPPRFVSGPSPNLSGSSVNGVPVQFQMSIAGSSINRALFTLWQAGYMCLQLDSDIIEASFGRRIDANTLSILLPSLAEFARDNVPILISLSPRFDLNDFPLVNLRQEESNLGPDKASIDLRLPGLGMDLYVYLEGRWSRIVGVSADIDLDLAIQSAAGSQIELTSQPPNVSNLEVNYSELLLSDNFDALLSALIDLSINAIITDSLVFDISTANFVSNVLNLPYEMNISSISVSGPNRDHLVIDVAFDPLQGGRPLTREINTNATLNHATLNQVTLNVSATGAEEPLFQYRFENGLWRPAQLISNGRLVIDEPRLRLNTDQTIEIRALSYNSMRRFDPTPAVVNISAPGERTTPQNMSVLDRGCQTAASSSGAGFWGLGLLLFLLCCRRSWIIIGVLFSGTILGCANTNEAPDLDCTQNSQCPIDTSCRSGRCYPDRVCSKNAECCSLEVCVQGRCRPGPTDDCTQSGCNRGQICQDDYCIAHPCDTDPDCPTGYCSAGFCQTGLPCAGRCTDNEVCLHDKQVCRPISASCSISCPSDTVRVATNSSSLRVGLCDLSNLDCQCVDGAGKRLGAIVRSADMTLVNGEPIFAVFDSFYEDLVLITGFETNIEQHIYLDGFEQRDGPSLTRGGQFNPGPRTGIYPQIVSDNQSRLHIVYYDIDDQDLMYLRREANGDWIPPITIDSDSDAGRHVRLKIDSNGRPHVVYTTIDSNRGWSGIRYARGTADPVTSNHFQNTYVAEQANHDDANPLHLPPNYFGARPCFAVTGERIFAAFQDAQNHQLYLAVGDSRGFEISRISGQLSTNERQQDNRYLNFEAHQIGSDCALQSTQGLIDLLFTNDTTGALMHYRAQGDEPGTFRIVDGGQIGFRKRVGSSVATSYDSSGRLIAVYQDATENDLRLNIFQNDRWLEQPIIIATDGALGFSNQIQINGSTAYISTVSIGTNRAAAENSRLELYLFDL